MSNLTKYNHWWESLPKVWQDIFIENLELNGWFSTNDIEYIATLTELDCTNKPIIACNH